MQNEEVAANAGMAITLQHSLRDDCQALFRAMINPIFKSFHAVSSVRAAENLTAIYLMGKVKANEGVVFTLDT